MKKSIFNVTVIAVCIAAICLAGWFVYTLVAVDGAGRGPHVPVVLGAIGVLGLAALVIRLALAGISPDDAPRRHDRQQDRDPFD